MSSIIAAAMPPRAHSGLRPLRQLQIPRPYRPTTIPCDQPLFCSPVEDDEIDRHRAPGTERCTASSYSSADTAQVPAEPARARRSSTPPDAIDLAEDRDRFKKLLERLKLRQPKSGIATSPQKAHAIAESIGYPIVIRPSYVLGGRAMEIVHDSHQLQRYVTRLASDLDRPSEFAVSEKRPLLIDHTCSMQRSTSTASLTARTATLWAPAIHEELASIRRSPACSPPHNLPPDDQGT